MPANAFTATRVSPLYTKALPSCRLLLINFRWKISAHAAGVAGVVALLIRIIRDGLPQDGAFLWLLIAIGLSGILGTARVWLGRHTAWQVIAGYAVGFLSVILMTLL